MKFTKIVLLSVCLLASLAVHAQDYSGHEYDGRNAQSIQAVVEGSVQDMREVTVQGGSEITQYGGAGVGGILGGILGSTIGKGGAGTNAATVVLAAAGALGGNYASQAVTREKAFEYIIKLDDGRVVAITQSFDATNNIATGDRVRIIQGNKIRIVKI